VNTLLALHVLALVLGVVGVVPAPFFYAFLLPFSGLAAAARFGRARAAGLFAATYAITLIAELWGTRVGLFGARYQYLLDAWAPLPGPLLFVAVPCMWFMMMLPSYLVARRVVRRGHVGVALLGAAIMTAWDVVLDPTSVAAGLWRWSGGTPSLYGIPVENYLSWYGGSAIVIALYSLADCADAEDDTRPLLAYAAVAAYYLGTPVALGALLGMGGAVALALLCRPRVATRTLRQRPDWQSPPERAAIAALERADFLRHPVKNHFVNSLHIVVAHGERYMIANLRRVRERLGGELRGQADWFVEQEGHHAAEHRRFSAQLGRLGYSTRGLDQLCGFVGQRLLPGLFGARMNLAITVAIEHWTASVAELVLGEDLLAELDPAARRIVEWHCWEELEHRAVAFDVFQAVSGSYFLRLAGLLVGVQLIALLSLVGLWSFLAQDRQLLSAAAWREGLAFFYLRQRLALRTLPRALELVRPGFHPNQGFRLETLGDATVSA
jgi:predicted metal-dependent hydrolase/uncharacterized membrane protein